MCDQASDLLCLRDAFSDNKNLRLPLDPCLLRRLGRASKQSVAAGEVQKIQSRLSLMAESR
jgi:hypothetical protein